MAPENDAVVQYRVLITGWRHWPVEQKKFIWRELDTLWTRVRSVEIADELPIGSVIIVHGKCPYGGVDLWAEQWAREHEQLWEQHPAERRNGRLLGPERNAKMVGLGADLCIGFPGPRSRGTWDCLEKATNAGIETYAKSWFEAIQT